MKERIAELDMVKGFFIVCVILSHVMGNTDVKKLFGEFSKCYASFMLFAMTAFYILSGYTYSQGKLNIKDAILKRAKSMLLPYYGYAMPMIAVFFIVYMLLEKRTMGWFLDGLVAIIFQLQSVHVFGSWVGVHEMMYSFFAAWFIFQLVVAFIIFVPLYHLIEKKNLFVKMITAAVLLGIGAVFYHLDLQQLNGRLYPPMCKMLVLPNVWGIAGLILLGKCISILDLLNVNKQSAGKKTVLLIVSLAIVLIGIATDDHRYNFPMGKWGAFGALSFFITPVCGVAMSFICVYIASLLKRFDAIKKAAMFFGKNSLDFLLVHFFFLWLSLYVMGEWHPKLSGVSLPVNNADKCLLNFARAFPLTMILSCAAIVMKKRLQAGLMSKKN